MSEFPPYIAQIIARGQEAMEAADPAKLGLTTEKLSRGHYVLRYAGQTWDVINYRYATRVRHWGYYTVWQANQRENSFEHLDAPTLRDMKRMIIFGRDYLYSGKLERQY